MYLLVFSNDFTSFKNLSSIFKDTLSNIAFFPFFINLAVPLLINEFFDAEFTTDRVGDMDTEMVREFFYAISYSAAMNLHLKLMHGSNNHHIMEAAFKAFAKALDEACSYDPRITDVLSTKGAL